MKRVILEVVTRCCMFVWLCMLVLAQIIPMAVAQPVPDYVPQVVVVQFEVAPFHAEQSQHHRPAGL